MLLNVQMTRLQCKNIYNHKIIHYLFLQSL